MRKQFLITLILLAISAVTVAAQPTLTIVTETPGLPSELFYGTVKVKPVRLRPGTNTPITIDDSDFFVQQHYIDFLRRFPDAPGFAHWNGEITMCNDAGNRLPGESLANCIDRKRENTSGAFYLSTEFQNSANYLIRINWGSLGKNRAPGTKCIAGQHSALDAVCRPLYPQYITDMGFLSNGVVVNNGLDHDRMNTNKWNFANQFVSRSDFLAEYPANMTAQAFIDKLEQTTGVALQAAEETALINDFNSPGSSCSGFTSAGFTSGRACVLFKMLDGTTTQFGGHLRFDTRYGQAYYNQEFNPAFVFVQYLGYLRRNADQAGYDHWLAKLNQHGGNFVSAQMVRSFIVSDEYRTRF